MLVDIYLSGQRSLATVRAQILRVGGVVTGEVDWYRKGVISAYLPLGQVSGLAASGSVGSMFASRPPRSYVGKVTSPGMRVGATDSINGLGYTGKGITVVVLSDSYDTATLTKGKPLKIHAAQDIASGDLPGPGNPLGRTRPIKVLEDGDATNKDEGRGMLQVIHDIAPDANLAFAGVFDGVAGFAQNIVKMRTGAKADIIVDDIG